MHTDVRAFSHSAAVGGKLSVQAVGRENGMRVECRCMYACARTWKRQRGLSTRMRNTSWTQSKEGRIGVGGGDMCVDEGGGGGGVRELGLGAILTRILGCSRLSLNAILGK